MAQSPTSKARQPWELVHQTIRTDGLDDRVVEVKLQQLAEITYIEHGFAEGTGKVDQTFLQVFVRDGLSPNCTRYRELTEGRVEVPIDEFHKTNGKHAVTDAFILCGRFQSFTFRAVGSFVADPDPSQMNSRPALPAGVPDLRAEATLPDSASSRTAVASPDLLPLAALPQRFQDALAPLAEYWQVVGMALGGTWPEALDSYLAQDAFGEVVSYAEDLVAILLEDTPLCPASLAELDRVRHRLGAGAREAAAAGGAAPPTVGDMPLEQFVRATVAWMGLAAKPAAGGCRALEFAGFAHAAALLLCTTQATAWLFLREGGLRRCAQVLHDFQATPAAPLVRFAAAVLCMLLSTCGDVAAALIAGVHAGPSAEDAPLAPPDWTRPLATPRRFWVRPPLPDPPAPAAAPAEQPAGAPDTNAPAAAADADAAAVPAEEAVVEVKAGVEVAGAPAEVEVAVREDHEVGAVRRSFSSESLSVNTSSLLGHSDSSQSVSSGDDHAEGPQGTDPASSPAEGAAGEGGQGVLPALRGQSRMPSPGAAAEEMEGGSESPEATGPEATGWGRGGAEEAVAPVDEVGDGLDDAGGAAAMDVDRGASAEADEHAQGAGPCAGEGADQHSGSPSRAAAGRNAGGLPGVVQAAPGEGPGAAVENGAEGTAEYVASEALPVGGSPASGASADAAGLPMEAEGAGAPLKRGRHELPGDGPLPGPPSPAKRGRIGTGDAPPGGIGRGGGTGSVPQGGPQPPSNGVALPVASTTAAAAADVAMVEAAEEAAGAAADGNPALWRLLDRCRREAGPPEDYVDALAGDEGFWAGLQTVEVPNAAALADLPPLPELLEHVLQLPQRRGVAALCALVLARLQVREALAAFASHTETLIGEVQQGRIQFRHVDNSIIVVAEALRRLTAAGDALERAPPQQEWQEAVARRRLPLPLRGDACYLRCVAQHGVLRRCLQVLKLPALIVDSLVETGSVLSGRERRSLYRRLRSHFVSPLRDFCCGLLATPQGSALLLQQGAPCADIAAVLAPPEPPVSGNAAADTSPESLLSEKLRYLVQAHAAWTAVAAAPLGSGDAQHAAHALLSAATQDRHMCQMLARTVQHLPEALEWLRRGVVEAVALDLAAEDPAAATDTAVHSRHLPEKLAEALQGVADPTRPLRREALLAPALLAVLAAGTLPLLPRFWADTLPPLLPLLEAAPACRSDALLTTTASGGAAAADVRPPLAHHSPVTNPDGRPQQQCWLAGCALTLKEHCFGCGGIGAVVGTLNALLPQLLPGLIHALPLGLKDWASGEPLCDTAAAAFVRLHTSAASRGRVTAALSVLAATVADPACASRAVAFAHDKGAMYVLPRAVAAAVTWVHGARAAATRAHLLGEARCPLEAAADEERALAVLHEACRAMCAIASALLAQPGQRSLVEKSERMHGRWRTVCHLLLAAYHAVHWCPENIRTFTGMCGPLSAPLEIRHLIAATLQRWVVSGSPICPLKQMLRAGARAEEVNGIDSLADDVAGGSAAQHVRGWHRPSGLTAALALLGDICPPPWPSNEAVQRVRNIDALTFPDLRRAVAASCDGVMTDLQALVGAARLSRSTAALAALVRALPRIISCASFIGNYLLGPLVQDLQAVAAAAVPARPLAAGRAHALLAVTVAVALHPLGKETLRENGLSIVLNDLLHKMVAAWGRGGASDADKAAYRVLCRLTLDALRFLCDYKVTMEPSKPLAQRLQHDMPPKKHLAQVTCGLLECLPFLEGSTGTAAVDLLRLIINAPYDPVIVSAIKAGADAAATAFNEEERRAVGGEVHLALSASSSSTLQYLAEELVRRAERLEAHGSRRNVSAACRDAAELLLQCAHLPTDPSSKPLEPVSAVDRICTAAAHAKAVHAKQAGPNPADTALPLDSASVLDLFGGADHDWFLQLFEQRQLPQEEEGGVEIVRRTRPRGEPLVATIPAALQPPRWRMAPAAAAPRVPLGHAPLLQVSRPLPKPPVRPTAKAQPASSLVVIPAIDSAEGSREGSWAGPKPGAAAVSSSTDGPFAVPATGAVDSGDLYADFTAAEPAPRASVGSKRRASVRSRVSSDSVAAPRPAAPQPAAPAGPPPLRPSVDPKPKPAEAPAAAPAARKPLQAGIMPATSRSGGNKRLPAGLLPANMAKPVPAGPSRPKPAPGLPPPPGTENTRLPPPPSALAPPSGGLPASDLPPPPPLAGQLYSRVPAAMQPAGPAQQPATQQAEAGDQGAAPAATAGDSSPAAAGAAVPAPIASEEQLASILTNPAQLRSLIGQNTPVGHFLREKLQQILKQKAAGK